MGSIKNSNCEPVPADVIHDGLWTDVHGVSRCAWCRATPLYQNYHDTEWGLPVTDDQMLFEKICLEGFQSGLSWLTILNKRENFRQAFSHFDHEKVARFGPKDVERLVLDAGIVRHRGKIESTINNAQRMRELVDEFGSLCSYAWLFDPEIRPAAAGAKALHARAATIEAVQLSADLKRRGWSFVGPTTVYAFMQAMGLVNDHLSGCSVSLRAHTERQALGPD
jgi:DNA-3-methyladenine glycosylase I